MYGYGVSVLNWYSSFPHYFVFKLPYLVPRTEPIPMDPRLASVRFKGQTSKCEDHDKLSMCRMFSYIVIERHMGKETDKHPYLVF